MLRELLFGVLFLALGACHSYRTIPGAAPVPGTAVVVALTDSGSVVLAREIGPGAIALEGEVESLGAQDIVLSVRRVRLRDGFANQWAGERVTVDRQLTSEIRERRFSPVRTFVFAAAVTAGAGALAGMFSGGSGSIGSGGGGGGSTPR
jgi:hypothetical protein